MQAATAVATEDPEQVLGRVQDLQQRLETVADPAARELAGELVAAIVQMYGAGLEAVLEALFAAGEPGERIAAQLAENPLVATLLLIHDLHPVALEDRVRDALERVRPYMESHGGDVELLSLQHGVARIRLRGSCSDCSASSVTLELAIKQALEELAPDLVGLEVEGVAPQTTTGPGLPMVTNSAPSGMELPVITTVPSWVDVPASAAALDDGSMTAVTVAGRDLVVANVEGTLLAYRDRCASCGGRLHDGELTAGALRCASCQRSYFLPRAGRALDDGDLQLEPVPLLREQGRVQVALAP